MIEQTLNIASATERIIVGVQSEIEFLVHREAFELAPLVQSEIELMLLTTMKMVGRFSKLQFSVGDCAHDQAQSHHIAVIPQLRWGDFRIDFCLKVPGLSKPIFVECDGHDFHERTKDQAERDRSKDRAIQAEGIPILRFTGREIWRDPGQVVVEILNFICRLKEQNK